MRHAEKSSAPSRALDSHQKTRILGENASLFFNRAFDKRT